MAAKESSGKYHGRIAAFLRDVMAIGNGLESIRLLPDEDVVFRRVFEASNTRAGLLSPVEVRVWEAVCGHPAIQKLAIRTGCAGELMAVCQPGFRSRDAAWGRGVRRSAAWIAAESGGPPHPVVLTATLTGRSGNGSTASAEELGRLGTFCESHGAIKFTRSAKSLS